MIVNYQDEGCAARQDLLLPVPARPSLGLGRCRDKSTLAATALTALARLDPPTAVKLARDVKLRPASDLVLSALKVCTLGFKQAMYWTILVSIIGLEALYLL